MTDSIERDDYDSPWKIILERFFPFFVAFFFPQAFNEIDWTRGHEFLDKELQEVTRDAKLGRRLVDKLVKVWLKTGEEAWVLIHVEVQGQSESDFPERMFVYHYRLFDRYHVRVASFAVLADSSRNWRPDQFGYSLWGTLIDFRFAVAKLLEYEQRWDELEASDNPFAVVVMAHLKAQATQHDPLERSRWKLQLAKGLYQRGWERQEVLDMFRFLDWIMWLPPELEQQFHQTIHEYEEEQKMEFNTPWERLKIQEGVQQGVQQGIQESILEFLELRFGAAALSVSERLHGIQDAALLRALRKQAATASSLEEFQSALHNSQA